MRVIAILFALLLSLPGLAAAQEWQEFVFQQDGISVNFPSKPTITETTWTSQLRYTLPARVYSVEKGPERYSMTVVDYRPLEEQGGSRAGRRARPGTPSAATAARRSAPATGSRTSAAPWPSRWPST